MQDERRIVIEVVDRATPSPERPRPKPEDQTPAQEAVEQTGKSDALLLGKSVFWNQIYGQAKNQIMQLGSTAISRYFKMREDYIGEQAYANTMTYLGKAVSFATSAVSGAKAGFGAGGPWGALAGVSIAVVGFGINEYIQGSNRIASAKISLNTQEYESAFQRSRAGLMDGGRGTMG